MELVVVGVRIIVVSLVAVAVNYSEVHATPIHLIRSGVVKAKSQQEDTGGRYIQGNKQLGVTLGQSRDGYDVNSERKYTNVQDAGKYNVENNDKKHHLDSGSFEDEEFHRKNADSIANIDKKVGHHKGHRKSGFHNTYHKEESGNNSSYYDDSNDDGDEYVHDLRKQTYADQGNDRNYGTYSYGAHRLKENAKKGVYDDRGSFLQDAGNRKHYNQGKYYDERADDGRLATGYDYGLTGRLSHQDYSRPPSVTKYYSSNYYQPPKRTITVYEDPRILHTDYASNTGNGDRFYKRQNYYSNSEPVNLDFRISPAAINNRNYYYDSRRPYYDYDYYYYK